MTNGRKVPLIAITLVTIATAGCSSAQSRYYKLDSTAVPGAAPVSNVAVAVGPVSVPASVDQPQFVVEVAPNRVEEDEFNRWDAPLNDGIARAVAGDLAVLLGTPKVAAAPFANFDPDYMVTIEVQRFDSIRGQAAIVDAVWTVRRAPAGEIRSGHTVAQENVQGDSFEALAAAHSRALASVSGDIATAIRSESSEDP